MQVKPIKTKLFRPEQDLVSFIKKSIPRVPEKSVIVITSKIVALSQGRIAPGGEKEKVRLIKKEAEQYIKTKWCYLALKEGHWCPSAGVDASNAKDLLIMWPHDIYKTAARLREDLRRLYKVKKLGILITDSRSVPLRAGLSGVTLGYAGFKGLKSYVGKPDLFGRALKMSRFNVADGLASTAVLVMGEGRERRPLALIKEAPVEFVDIVDPHELRIEPRDDLYRPVFDSLRQNRRRK